MKKVIMIFIILLFFFLGVYIGKLQSNVILKTVTRIEKIGPIKIPDPIIVKPVESIPEEVKLPERVINTSTLQLDSTKLYLDYIKKRSYINQVMYDNLYGKYTVSYDVQYNEVLRFYDPILEPTREVIEHTIVTRFIPFVESGYSTADYVNVGGGLMDNKLKLGIRYNYLYDLRKDNRNGHLITIIKTF